MANNDTSSHLIVSEANEIKAEIVKEEIPADARQTIVQEAHEFVKSLLAVDPSQIRDQQLSVNKVENIGVEQQQKAAKQTELLKLPIATLSKRAEDGGEVANALIDLKMTVESLDPSQVNFHPGWFSRLLGHLPFVGTPIKRYLTKFESAQTVITAIIKSLEMGRDQLLRDNVTLKEDQTELWDSEKALEKTLVYAHAVDDNLEEHRQSLLGKEPEQTKYIEEYLQFPIKQRLIDLQQQIIVQQQTVLASELIIRNNKELVRGVNRALNVTVTALQNATTIALALANQEKVLQKIEKINETTSKLITDSAKKLKTQGTLIHKQAASAQIDVQALKTALADLNIALDEITSFREKAIPEMAHVIEDLDGLIKETQKPLSKIEKK